MEQKTKQNTSKQAASVTYTLEKNIFAAATFKGCESLRLGQIIKLEVYFGLYEPSFTFIGRENQINTVYMK